MKIMRKGLPMLGPSLLRIGWRGCFVWLLLMIGGAAQSQTLTTGTAAAPAVQDEPDQPEPQAITAPYAGASAGAAAGGTKTGLFASVPQAREEIRRAFIKQDYERVLALNREMVRQFSVDDSNSFYLTAAQLRLTDQRELKAGKRHFLRLGDQAPQLADSLPTVESALNAVPAANLAQPVANAATLPGTESSTAGEMPAVEVTPEATPVETPAAMGTPIEIPAGAPEPTPFTIAAVPTPTIEEPAPGEGILLPAHDETAQPAETPAVIGAAVAETPAPTPALDTPSDQAQGEEFRIAAAMTPLPVPETVATPTAPAAAPRSDLMRNITFALLACALLTLAAVLLAGRRRRETEPEEDLVTTLSGLKVDARPEPEAPAPMARTAERPSAPAPEPELEPSLLGEEESAFEPIPTPAPEPELTQSERIDAFSRSMFGEPGEPETLEQLAESREVAEPPVAASEDKSLLQITGISEEPPTAAQGAAEPITHFQGEAIGPPINLDTLPDLPEEKKWEPGTDTISLDAFADQPPAAAAEARDPLVEDLAPFGRGEPAPELQETRGEPTGNIARATDEAAPHEITRTSWDAGSESTGNIAPDSMDLPSLPTAEDNLTSFHPDETIDVLKPGEIDLEATMASQSIEAPAAEPGEETIASRTVFEVPLGDKPAEEDLFDREYRIGLECFDRQDWGPAVHHLSVAAALRPEQQQVKDKLREARRLRKI